jgi:hypothetical protein
MEHDDVIEQLELAAVEPDGLARLMAGDTAIAAAVAGHLAGCDACTTEFERLGRAAPLLRDVVRTTPPADLRERTLAYVRERGEPRGATTSTTTPATLPPTPAPAPDATAVPAAARRRATSRIVPWVASLAAAVVLAVAATSYLADQQATQRLADQERAIGGLEAVANATIDITGRPDAERVSLAAADTDAWGSLLFSPATSKLVVVATGLDRPPAGKEYRCWVELAGKRENVGRMYFADDLAYWVGDTPAISEAAPGTTFGVSLADVDGLALDAPPVLAGEL